jgi:hypothetical protein
MAEPRLDGMSPATVDRGGFRGQPNSPFCILSRSAVRDAQRISCTLRSHNFEIDTAVSQSSIKQIHKIYEVVLFNIIKILS